ncbi:TPR-like protein [Leucogyrophana mollusca]|uniref:TPR-like protein n=1 Tax=Leucogyrophana mollusca TaxID=85980 RepID=A0ACB8BGG9_9AGAM|nr:TPR-like protein [Leucogyrophana mollusca]
MAPPQPDPAMQARIEADFHPVDLALSGPNESLAFCGKHKLEKCPDCDVDFSSLNRMSKILHANPNLRCPPPGNVVQQKLSQAVTTTKDEGNNLYKNGKHKEALARYNMAASIAIQRPPWENNAVLREELSTVVSNRSAALFELGDFIGALVDAETVISIRRNWSKGHFRKAKALVGLGQIEEAKEAVALGLSFEPNNQELNGYMTDLVNLTKTRAEAKAKKSVEKAESVTSD